jgi:hypothetical protein
MRPIPIRPNGFLSPACFERCGQEDQDQDQDQDDDGGDFGGDDTDYA